MTIRKTRKIGEARSGSSKVRPSRLPAASLPPATLPAAQSLGRSAATEGLAAAGKGTEPARAPARSPSRGQRHVVATAVVATTVVATTVVATTVATDRASLRSDQRRLAELKVKLGDEDYMNGAILRIATVLSARLTLR